MKQHQHFNLMTKYRMKPSKKNIAPNYTVAAIYSCKQEVHK